MRTTHKRGFGRGAEPGAGAVLPPSVWSAVAWHRQPGAPARSTRALLARIALSVLLGLIAIGLGIGGGLFLWFHESLVAVAATTPDLKRAEKQLDAVLPGQPTTALVLGDNQRKGLEADAGGRSDTILIVRADPQTKTISVLSLPRDLRVPVYCASKTHPNDPNDDTPMGVTRIDYAFAYCGASGSLATIKRLTGLHFNYVITVGFTGFKEIVNDIGGIWLNIDRRYYNRNNGTAATDYSNINLEPGYQLLTGGAALQFVRFRHTDSDFYRQARDQEFLSSLKGQLTKNLSPFNMPGIVSAITQNISVAGDLNDSRVLGYALFALGLPTGHILSTYISDTDVSSVNVGGADELYASPQTIEQAVYSFTHPDVGLAKKANDAALGIKASTPKHKKAVTAAPPPPADKTTVTVLNGNGVAGAAANGSYLLAQRGYVTELPPGGQAANAPMQNYFDSEIYYDPARSGAHAAADALSEILAPSVVKLLPVAGALRALDPGAMLLVVVGETFHNELVAAPPPPATHATVVVPRVPANVAFEPSVTEAELKPYVHSVPFQLELPTVLEASSSPDMLGNGYGEPPDVPIREYQIVSGHKAIVLVYVTGGRAFWDIEETDWAGAPIFQGRSFTHVIGGRTFQLFYNGPNLHMVLLHEGSGYYWVTNSLLNALSNETMIAIAKGLKPYPHAV